LTTRIEIDGGIDRDNIAEVAAAGAEIIVSGSAIFSAKDPGVAFGNCVKRQFFGFKRVVSD